MSYATLKAVSNILVHVPGLLQYGTTIQQEQRAASPSPFLKEWRGHVRSFEQAVLLLKDRTAKSTMNSPFMEYSK